MCIVEPLPSHFTPCARVPGAASSDGVRFGGLAKGWAHVLALQCLGAALGPQSTLALLKGLPLLSMGSACLIPSFSCKCKFTCEVSSFVIELIPVFFIKDYRTRHLAGQRCHITSSSRPLQGDTTVRCFSARRAVAQAEPPQRVGDYRHVGAEKPCPSSHE